MSTGLNYVRVSDPTDPHAPSLDTQRAALDDWCAAHGVTVLDTLRETHSGVELHERPALQRLLTRCAEGGVDYAVFYSLDRFSRDPEHQMWLRVTLAGCGTRLVCVSEPIPEDDTGVLLQFVGGWASKREWRQIRERSLRGKRDRAAKGLPAGAGVPPYGYARTPDKRAFIVLDEQQRIVVLIFTWTAEGRGMRWVAAELNRRGVPPPSTGKAARPGAAWGHSQIRRILTNPIYVGQGARWRWRRWVRDGTVVISERERDEWLPLNVDVAAPLIEPALWQAAWEARRRNVGDRTRNQARPALLRGRIVCGVCGHRCGPELGKGARPYYRCLSRQTRQGACGARMVPAESVEAWAWGQVRAAILRPRLVAGELARQATVDTGELAAELAAAEARVGRIEAGQRKLLAAFRGSDALPEALVKAELAAAEQEKRQAERRVLEARARLTAVQASRETVLSMREALDRVRVNLDLLDVSERVELLDLLGVRVRAAGGDPCGWELEPAWLRGDLDTRA